MTQEVFLGKDIYFAVGDNGAALTEISGVGNGLRSVALDDQVATPQKAGTGDYPEHYSAERHAITGTIAVQWGDRIRPLFHRKQGQLLDFELGPEKRENGKERIRFSGFVNVPLNWDTGADSHDVDMPLQVSGEPTYDTYSGL